MKSVGPKEDTLKSTDPEDPSLDPDPFPVVRSSDLKEQDSRLYKQLTDKFDALDDDDDDLLGGGGFEGLFAEG